MEEIAAIVSQTLETAGIIATLSGGGAVTIYSMNDYMSFDLDFVTSERNSIIADAIAPLGFHQVIRTRQFEHPDSEYYLEFPPGPLSFGETVILEQDMHLIHTDYGTLRIVTPTQSIMDRIAAYVHWTDNQSFDQAIAIARKNKIDWEALNKWSTKETIDPAVIERLKTHVNRGLSQ
ncbi:MAG: hypothetical protein JJE36_01210 [Coriobacteriia bacterium]|nr:hypothetical protein [Coriobacteriia bacterium]